MLADPPVGRSWQRRPRKRKRPARVAPVRVFEIFLCLVIYGVITLQARTLWLAQQQQAQTSYEPAARTVVAVERAAVPKSSGLVAKSFIGGE